MKRIICLLVITSILISTYGCQSEKEIYEIKSGVESALTLDEKILSNIYYENDEIAFFHGNNMEDIMKNIYDYYSIFWLISLDKTLNAGIIKEFKSLLGNVIKSGDISNDEQYKYDGVFDIYLRAGIESVLGLKENTETYINQLDKFYDSNKNLYAIEGNSIEDYIRTTNIALRVCLELDYIPEYIYEIRHMLYDLCTQNIYFNESDIDLKRDIISVGMIIIDNIRLFDLLTGSNSLNDLKHLNNWVAKLIIEYNSYTKSLNSYDPIVLQGGIIVRDINKYMNLSLQIEDVPDINIKSYFVNDCQVVFQYITIKENLDMDSISKHIRDNYKYHIYCNKPAYNLRDVYYGIMIYELIGLPFSKDKILSFVNKYIQNEILGNDDVFHIVKIFEILEINDSIIKEFIDSYDISKFYGNSNSENNYQLVYLSMKYNFEIPDNELVQIVNLASKTIDETEIMSPLYYSLLILNLKKYPIDVKKVLENISRFSRNDGYSAAVESKPISMYSLFRVYDIMNICESLNNDTKNTLRKYAERLRAPYGGFFIFDDGDIGDLEYDENFSLQAYYYGLILSSL